MDEQYKAAYEAAENLRNKIQDMLDNRDDPNARQLLDDAHRLYNDAKSKKNPRTLEDQTKSIMRLLQSMRSSSEPAISYPDIDFLHKSYEQLMMAFRKFENY